CTRDYFKEQGHANKLPDRGPLAAITVPGAVGTWGDMHQKYGKLEWKEIMEPARKYAEEGFPMTKKFIDYMYEKRSLLESTMKFTASSLETMKTQWKVTC